MQADKLIAGLERFFYDIVGSLIPGAILLSGLWLLVEPPLSTAPQSSAGWWLFVAVAFVVGNGMATFGELTLVRVAPRLTGWLLPGLRKKYWRTAQELQQALADRPTVRKVASHALPGVMVDAGHVSSLRNIAMSIIPADDRATVIRFMFLSLMSLGAATATIALTAVAVALHWDDLGWMRVLLLAIGGVLTSLLFLIRRFEFYDRSQRLPFDMAVGAIQADSLVTGERSSVPETRPLRSVYLAGGHRNPWREQVKSCVPGLTYFDPAQHGIADARAYTAWDLEAVRRCDVVFAFLESTNPSGFGMALEIGYAAALSKHVVFIDEKSATDSNLERYLRILHEASSASFQTLDDGIGYLQRLNEQLAK